MDLVRGRGGSSWGLGWRMEKGKKENGEGKEEGEWRREERNTTLGPPFLLPLDLSVVVELWEKLEALFCWWGKLKSIRLGRWRF